MLSSIRPLCCSTVFADNFPKAKSFPRNYFATKPLFSLALPAMMVTLDVVLVAGGASGRDALGGPGVWKTVPWAERTGTWPVGVSFLVLP